MRGRGERSESRVVAALKWRKMNMEDYETNSGRVMRSYQRRIKRQVGKGEAKGFRQVK